MMSDLDGQRAKRPGNRGRIDQIKNEIDREVLRDRIIAAIAKADQDWGSDNSLHEDMADAVIRELALEVEDGECNYCHAALPGCRHSTWTDNG